MSIVAQIFRRNIRQKNNINKLCMYTNIEQNKLINFEKQKNNLIKNIGELEKQILNENIDNKIKDNICLVNMEINRLFK